LLNIIIIHSDPVCNTHCRCYRSFW